MIQFSIKGIPEMIKEIGKLRDGFNREIKQALMAETGIEVKECQKESPVESAAMQKGIHAEGPFQEGKRIWSIVCTSPESQQYDLIQHEDPDLIHRVGKWKFIADPLKASAPYMAGRIAARVDLNRAKK